MKNQKFHFSQPDLQLFYINEEGCANVRNKYEEYYIFILLNGTAKIEYPDKIGYIKKGDTFLANKDEKFKIYTNEKHIEFVEIRFQAKFFHELDTEVDILKSFENNRNNKFKILNEETKNEFYNSAVKNVMRSLIGLSSRAFVLSSVLQLICELHYIQNTKSKSSIKETDSNFTRLYSYINNHLFEKLTIKKVADAVFLSPRSVTNILRRISKMSFHEFVTNERLKESKAMIDIGAFKLNEVASNCGFETYSTFFRAFLKQFGITPSEYKRIKQKPKF